MTGWNFADVWEAVADVAPERPAVVQGDSTVSWADFDRCADAVGRWLLDAGLGHQARVGQYLYNGSAYLESMFGIMKVGQVPVNTNYRYVDDELVYLWNEAGAEAVIFDSSFVERTERVRSRARGVKAWLCVGDDGPCPDWAVSWVDVVSAGLESERANGRWGRSGDDLYLLFTGGTTGMPKGVMWRQDDWFVVLNNTGVRPYGETPDLDRVRAAQETAGPVTLPACPLMHGTGSGAAMGALSNGGTVALLEGRSYDPAEVLDAVERHRVKSIYLIGDPQARPLVTEFERDEQGRDLASLRVLISSGAMLSAQSKRSLHQLLPGVAVIDALGSSEALGAATATTQESADAATGRFRPGPWTKVLTDDGREVVPGSGEVGRVAVGGRLPLGYQGDADKTAATFVEFGGVRYSIAGDHATVGEDGYIELLGRGSVSINTGGEKVFPDEVEAVLKEHPAIVDTVVVGVPDDRFGSAVTAVVELADELADGFGDDDLVAHARERLASYKVPRHVVRVETIGRAANGKADYRRLRELAEAQLRGDRQR